MSLGIAGVGSYLPERVRTAAEIADRSGIPEPVVRDKFGVREVRVAGPDDHVSAMSAAAARAALNGFPVEELDLVVYTGSEFKDHVVWSAATDIARQLGAQRAAAVEVHALCAATPIALKTVSGMMAEDASLRSALVVGAARENDLIDYRNPRSRFMNNFGAGASALLVLRDGRNRLLGSAFKTDARCSRDVVMWGGGSAFGPSADAFGTGANALGVPDPEGMRERLEVSLDNFIEVGRRALDGRRPDFVAVTHMKRSMHDAVLYGLEAESSVYLDDTGHCQSADQGIALERGIAAGLVEPGSVVLLLAAGTGYTWSAAALEWG
ncbi:MAG TPA: 3-oxoacyl-ACP synthase [Candidatus Dormibacteraeota bacterium]